MRTLLTVAQQNEFIKQNGRVVNVEHYYSNRGLGTSKIFNSRKDVISKASGCGYDRFGTVIGLYIEEVFNKELQKLGKRFCDKKGNYRGSSTHFYGMFKGKDGNVYLDGGCGIDSMNKILYAIGFQLDFVGETSKSVAGSEFYTLTPVSKSKKDLYLKDIK